MKRQKKKYETPLRPWDKQRLEEEKKLLRKFGLKNKKEIWRAEAIVRKFRRMAREIAATYDKEKERILINKVVGLGLLKEGATLDDVLGLTVENLLERRLQTILKNKGLANTIKHARQLITHGHVKINGRKVTYPSYVVPINEEDSIVVDKK
jgi:small subunit ribosomal protein S4